MHTTRWPLLLPACLTIACSTTTPRDRAKSTAAQWEYVLKVYDPTREIVDVEARFTALPAEDPELHLALPERYAFVQFDEPLLSGEIEARDTEGTALALVRESPYRWKVTKGAAREVRISYSVPLTHRQHPAVLEREDGYDHPYLASDHGLLVTAALLVAPISVPMERAHVRLRLPSGWKVECPWPQTKDGAYVPEDLRALQGDLIAVGAWSAEVVEAGRMKITIAFAPGQPSLAKIAVPVVRPLVEAEVALFGVAPREKYLFLFGRPEPRKTPGVSLAGSPKTGSMNLAVSGEIHDGSLGARIAHLVAHEFFHTWAQARYETPPELRFVAEGFTDYYANLVPARAGVTTWEDFAQALGEALTRYDSARAKIDLSLSAAGGDAFFSDRNAYDVVYQGGLLLAAVIDQHIRTRGDGKNLDDLMRALSNDPRWSDERAPSFDDFLTLIGQSTDSAFEGHVRKLCTLDAGFDAVAELAQVGVTATSTPDAPPRPAWRVDARAWSEAAL